MPRLADDKMETSKIAGMNAFQFSATRIEHLGATEYTLVSVAVDETGSVAGFEDDLLKMLIAAVDSCKKSPRSNNLLVRVIAFSTQHRSGVREIHGFKPLSEINTADYQPLQPAGGTPLIDACFSAVGATNEYGAKLTQGDFLCNGILYVITDGEENSSTSTMKMLRDEVKKSVQGERLESLITILIGINASSCAPALDQFKNDAGLTQFIDAGNVTPRKLAKIANFVSTSVSSQSQAIGTGGPSQNIAPDI